MPIRRLYPIDWRQFTDMACFECAKGRCKHCDRSHGKIVCHFGNGRCREEEAGTRRDGRDCILRKSLPA